MFKLARSPASNGPGSESAWPELTKERREELDMRARRSSYGRGAGSHIRARSGAAKLNGRVRDARGQIRVGPDHGLAVSLTAVFAFSWAKSGWSLPGRWTARRWEADR